MVGTSGLGGLCLGGRGKEPNFLPSFCGANKLPEQPPLCYHSGARIGEAGKERRSDDCKELFLFPSSNLHPRPWPQTPAAPRPSSSKRAHVPPQLSVCLCLGHFRQWGHDSCVLWAAKVHWLGTVPRARLQASLCLLSPAERFLPAPQAGGLPRAFQVRALESTGKTGAEAF